MPLYFAYGSNMDRVAMAARCPRSKPIGLARLPRHRFLITTDGYASVLRDPRRTVHGVLWDLALADVPALDRYESLHTGLYTKIVQPVVTPAGPRRALVYVGRSAVPGKPKPAPKVDDDFDIDFDSLPDAVSLPDEEEETVVPDVDGFEIPLDDEPAPPPPPSTDRKPVAATAKVSKPAPAKAPDPIPASEPLSAADEAIAELLAQASEPLFGHGAIAGEAQPDHGGAISDALSDGGEVEVGHAEGSLAPPAEREGE